MDAACFIRFSVSFGESVGVIPRRLVAACVYTVAFTTNLMIRGVERHKQLDDGGGELMLESRHIQHRAHCFETATTATHF